ncbi:hypothetical protein IZ6_05130 [Terrihabitans soli]|uniref:DUF1007 family protein n=1 Tax=Terrihabitans soli TaxID=708113 RepID=A0A6S6QTJ2_9HYPH|nr:DUF1007 family protein [Terrihabitans soli]BCJ89778.1 hypothetical protein IZ6_05130 [Terrihabitans soli]
MSRRLLAFLALFASLFSALPAAAHPHVFVTVKSTIVYEKGVPKAVRHNWRFDDMFSAFAVQGLDTDSDGQLSRAELQALAEVNVTSLKEFDYFTFGTAGSGDLAFAKPVDYWLEHDGTALTLHFTLPVRSAKPSDTVRVEIYDPSYFVAFALAEQNPVALEGAPEGCRADAEASDDASSEKLSEDFFSNLDPQQGWGKQFANAFVVRCGEAATAFATSQQQKAETAQAEAAAAPEKAASRVETALKITEAQPLGDMPEQKVKTQDNKALGAFGVVAPEASAVNASSGVFGWIAAQQAKFYKAMSDALTASKDDGSAFLLLASLAFSYGVFHAAGPGHGKAVISSYLLATGETLRRGIAISFAASLAQAVTAILVVGIFAIILGVTSQVMGVAAWWLEAASYALIVLLGVGIMFRRSLIPLRGSSKGHVHDEACDHSHGPKLEDLDGEFGWRRAAAAVLAVGLRPCTGALLILVFALAQGLIWTGIAATFAMALGTAFTVATIATLAVTMKQLAVKLAAGSSTTRTRRALRLIEITAGFAVLAFGLILLGGLLQAGVPAAAAG